MRPFCVHNNCGDHMEKLPEKAKGVVGIYSAVVTFIESVGLFFGVSREDFIVWLVALLVVATVWTYVYIVLFFRHYRYSIKNGVVKIQKGALFKRRHLVYLEKVSMITVKENFVHRWFSLCTVYFYVQGSVVKLSFVEKDKSEVLKEILDSGD